MSSGHTQWDEVAAIVRDAGGRIVGRTRLQKVAYLLKCAGFGSPFTFEYHYYGPYSEELSDSIQTARAFGLLSEEERLADWGGSYSIYESDADSPHQNSQRSAFASAAASIGAVELELAATAAFLKAEGFSDPWQETKRRKPEKATPGKIQLAKAAYESLRQLDAPRKLPTLT